MPNYYVTFPRRFAHEPHPRLGEVPTLPEQWVRIEAHSLPAARGLVQAFLDDEWAVLHHAEKFEKDSYPGGEHAVIRVMPKRFGFELVTAEQGEGTDG